MGGQGDLLSTFDGPCTDPLLCDTKNQWEVTRQWTNPWVVVQNEVCERLQVSQPCFQEQLQQGQSGRALQFRESWTTASLEDEEEEKMLIAASFRLQSEC